MVTSGESISASGGRSSSLAPVERDTTVVESVQQFVEFFTCLCRTADSVVQRHVEIAVGIFAPFQIEMVTDRFQGCLCLVELRHGLLDLAFRGKCLFHCRFLLYLGHAGSTPHPVTNRVHSMVFDLSNSSESSIWQASSAFS